MQSLRCSPVAQRTSLCRAHVSLIVTTRKAIKCRSQGSDQAEKPLDQVPPGCSRYDVKLTRPLGMALETNSKGEFTVAEVHKGGAADVEGQIKAGDRLISCSGIVFNKETEYNEIIVKSGEQKITLNVTGEKFDTVMACLQTHRAGVKVDLMLQRC